MIEIANTVYRLTEAMNELPIARQKARDAIEETIVSLCKLLDKHGTTQTGTQDD